MKKSCYQRPTSRRRLLSVAHRSDSQPVVAPAVPAVPVLGRQSECHVTPPPIAARMVEYLGPVGDYLTLEPHAGTGNLISALLDAGHSPRELVSIEREQSLCRYVRKRFSDHGIAPMCRCFLDYANEASGGIQYPRILLNPPFKQVKKHMAAALSLLGRGGHAEPARLVALVPVTYEHEHCETLELLPADAFGHLRIHTKLIRAER